MFGDLHNKEFIYKEEALMRLSEFSVKLEVNIIHALYMYNTCMYLQKYCIHMYMYMYMKHLLHNYTVKFC